MSTDQNDGPLTRLSKLLGIDHKLAPIEAVKRIEERPVSLNAECFFKMRPAPELCGDETINRLWEGGPVLPTRLRRMEFDRVPVGHDTGYRCYDGEKHDSESAFTSGEFGDGLTEDEAYVDWLRNVDPEPRPRMGRLVDGGGGSQPPEYKAEPYRDPDEDDSITFDDGLTDDDAR